MKIHKHLFSSFRPLFPAVFLAIPAQAAPAAGPAEWIEPTGHKVIRLSKEAGSSSFYFHQNGYTADGDKLVISTPAGLSAIKLQTREIEPLAQGRADQVVVGRKTRRVFYIQDGAVFTTHLDTHET